MPVNFKYFSDRGSKIIPVFRREALIVFRLTLPPAGIWTLKGILSSSSDIPSQKIPNHSKNSTEISIYFIVCSAGSVTHLQCDGSSFPGHNKALISLHVTRVCTLYARPWSQVTVFFRLLELQTGLTWPYSRIHQDIASWLPAWLMLSHWEHVLGVLLSRKYILARGNLLWVGRLTWRHREALDTLTPWTV
jgi:hypothetical protein